MVVINLFGAPGAGKSTGASYIFSKLKMLGVNAEFVPEYAKLKCWEENNEVFKNQIYIFGKQSFQISRLDGKVDVVVTDGPLLLSSFYNTSDYYGKCFNELVFNVFNHYNNLNFFIKRVKEYNPKGRFQTEDESNKIQVNLMKFLNDNHIKYEGFDGDIKEYDTITNYIYNYLNIQRKGRI